MRRTSGMGSSVNSRETAFEVPIGLRAMIRDARVQDLVIRDPFVGLTWKRWNIPPADPLAPEDWDAVAAWFDGRSFQRKGTWRPHPRSMPSSSSCAGTGHARARRRRSPGTTWISTRASPTSGHRTTTGPSATRRPEPRGAASSYIRRCSASCAPCAHCVPSPGSRYSPTSMGTASRPRPSGRRGSAVCKTAASAIAGLYGLKDTFVTHTLAMAEESGEVERLTA